METEQEEGRTGQERMEGCRAVEIQDRKEWKHGWRKLYLRYASSVAEPVDPKLF